MFNLTRYYSIASLFCILVAAAVLGLFYRQLSIDSLMTMAEDRNAALTRVFGNALWPHFAPLLDTIPDAHSIAAGSGPEVARLRQEVVALMQDTSVVKIKIYNTGGQTVFSTEAGQIGENRRDNAGFLAAAGGQPASELTHHDSFSAFDRVIEKRDLLSSYLPFRREPNGRVEGVFELYYDITPFLADVKQTQWQVFIGVAAVLTLLYGLLYLVVRRATIIMRRQEADLNWYLGRIEENNQLLDQRVQERTQALQAANRALEAEIAERARAEERLRLSAKVFESAAEGVVITDASGRILAVNKAFTVITGYDEQDVVDKTPRMLQSGQHDPQFYSNMWSALNDGGQWIGEIWNRRKSGEIYPEWLTIAAVKDTNGVVGHYVGVFSDITSIKKSQERLDFLAHHDLLTSLPNRLLFNDRLAHGIARARRNEQQLAVLFVDLDNFKNVNDTLGHHLGDELLKNVAEQIAAQMRTSDSVARVGGDEFILLLEDIEVPRYAAAVAEKVLGLLRQPITVSGYELFVTASIGVSFFPTDGDDVETLVKNADTAMYEAKRSRNSYQFYAPEMSTYASERVHIEALLRRSIERDELVLHYQPQVDLASMRLEGAEALVRWNSPELGLVSPLRLIPVAEDIGFIAAIGEWVLRTACRQMLAWDATGLVVPRMAVNLSVKQLEHGNIVDLVSRVLDETGLAASRLELEVTESVIMQSERALTYLDGLRALGVELAVDDFGTGYSSLSYLRRLPVQKLKIDRSFIADVCTEPSREAIVRAIIALASALGLRCIAEGIETETEAAFLRNENCHEGQGYLYGGPLPADEFTAAWASADARNAAGTLALDVS